MKKRKEKKRKEGEEEKKKEKTKRKEEKKKKKKKLFIILCSSKHKESLTAPPLFTYISNVSSSLLDFRTVSFLLLFQPMPFLELRETNKWFSVAALIVSVNTNSQEQLNYGGSL